jgi:hypothetical protein
MVISSSRKIDFFIPFLPSLTHFSGDSPPKNSSARGSRPGVFGSAAEKRKRKLFQTDEKKNFTNRVHLEYHAANF